MKPVPKSPYEAEKTRGSIFLKSAKTISSITFLRAMHMVASRDIARPKRYMMSSFTSKISKSISYAHEMIVPTTTTKIEISIRPDNGLI